MRRLAALGAALLLAGIAVPPASADDSQLDVFAGISFQVVVPATGVATEADVDVDAFDPSGQDTAAAHDVTVTVTFPVGGPVTGTSSYPGCTTADTTVTCQIPTLSSAPGQGITIPLMLTAQPGAPDGADAGMTIGVTASDAHGSSSYPQPVTVLDSPNIVVSSPRPPLLDMARGERAAIPQFTVTNTGMLPALGMTLVFGGDYYAPLKTNSGNCQTSANAMTVVCFVDNVVQPGESYQVVNPPTFRLGTDTVATPAGQMVTMTDAQIFPGDDVADTLQYGGPYTAGTGTPLTLLRTAGTGTPTTTTQTVPQHNFAGADSFGQPVRAVDGLTTNLAAVGSRVTQDGDIPATIEVGVRNAGPASLIDHVGTGIAFVHFDVPGGATVTEAPQDCQPVTADGTHPEPGTPGYAAYDCRSQSLLAHTRQVWDFQLTLATGIRKATGSATLRWASEGPTDGFPAAWDSDPTDDTAPATVVAAG